MPTQAAQLAPSLMPIAPRPDLVFVRGAGAYLYDRQGRRYLDWVQGWAVNCLGHLPAAVTRALSDQAATLINPSPAFYNEPAIELAELLTRHSCFDRVFFGSSGAEANEGAIKLARKWGQLNRNGAFEIIGFANGFHGRTLATMSASGKPGWDKLFAPQVPGFPKAPLNDLDAVRALIGPRTVAVMLELIQGEAGVIPADVAFVKGLRELCDAHGLLLIVDEVQTGCGRTGTLFAHEQYGVEPDIMTLGKGLGGGVPLSALAAKESCCCFAPGDQGGTYCGNPLDVRRGCGGRAQPPGGRLPGRRSPGWQPTGRGLDPPVGAVRSRRCPRSRLAAGPGSRPRDGAPGRRPGQGSRPAAQRPQAQLSALHARPEHHAGGGGGRAGIIASDILGAGE